jgi:hypothetical protein
MNSRERLLCALRCGTPDRVPVSTYELVGHNSAAWENNDPSYAPLMDAIRARTDCICMWNPDCDAKLFESAHPVDTQSGQWREGDVTVCRTTAHTPRGPLTRTTRVVDGVHTVWQTEHWCKSTDDVDAAMSVPFEPVSFDAAAFGTIRAEVGDNGIVMATVGDPLLNAADLMGFEDYTMWALAETEHFARAVAVMHERGMENLRRMLDAGVTDLYRIVGPEYAAPPFLPPEMFARFVVPYVREMTDLIHSRGALVRLHCHGRIGRVLDDILATGADAVDPCEAPPDGDIVLAEVKRRLTGRMCVFGNIQLKLLEHGTPEQVEAEVEACMDAAKAGGGYVLMPTAAPINTPLSPGTARNYLRYIESAERLRDY